MEPLLIKDRTAIVGIGQTAFGKGFVESEEQLACQAIKMALDEAGISPSEVDGLSSYMMQTAEEEEIARDLGFGDLTFFSRLPAGGGGAVGTVGHVAMGVATGQCTVGVAYRARKRSAKASRVWMGTPDRVTGRVMWQSPFGHIRPADDVAFLARRYMHEFGATRDHFANIALAFRKHANRNPNAVMKDRPMTREQYMDARWISEPLCLYDCCLETDGALAVVVVSADRAKDLPTKPAYIHAFGQGIASGNIAMFNYRAEDPFYTQAYVCGRKLWEYSDFKAKDVDTAQIYDAFSPEIIFSLEGFGFCKRGEGAAFTENGAIEIGGRLPLNTGGGGLSEAYVHGFNHILEAVRQVRGTSCNQVPDVKCSFVSSSDGVPNGAILLHP